MGKSFAEGRVFVIRLAACAVVREEVALDQCGPLATGSASQARLAVKYLRNVLGAVGLVLACLNAAACVSAVAPPSEEVAAATRGFDYAQQTCASCHAIAAGEALSPNPAAPPFQAIAETPGMTVTALDVWLHSPHPTMPHLLVEPEHIDDVSAYLRSLR
jgi:mono/diheme cytochrome c family protein